MLKREKAIRDALAKGKKIYEIPEVCVYRSKKPSQTEPGQALSVRARVALADAGVGSLGITDALFDFDENTTLDEALRKTRMDLLPAGVSSLYDVLQQRTALYEALALARQKAGGRAAGVSKSDTPPSPVQPREADVNPAAADAAAD